jgi:hypothetical protein
MGTPNTATSISRWFFCTAIVFSTLALSGCAPSNLENCLADAAKAPTESGVALAANSCHQKFSPELKKEPKVPFFTSENKTRNLCYVYWDGVRWKEGKTKGDDFRRYRRAKYGVELVEISIPRAMTDSLGLTKSVSGEAENSQQLYKFLDKYWHQIETLCDIS